MTDISAGKELAREQKKQELIEQLWLGYFNQTLYEQGIITQAQRDRIKNKISSRSPSRGL